ncbi:MAG TPA: response regulator [Kofleriaceae bacterium]|nr:response regulator [Kofleriaceae bacterium]
MVRLLIVEDELLVAQSLATLLEVHGHQVLGCVATAADAEATALEGRPELVLMDIHLDGADDGIEAARRIRARLDVPIVFLTAYADRAHLDRAKGSEPHAYLLKPYSDRELLTTIEIVEHRHRGERAQRTRDRWLGTALRSIADGVLGVGPDQRVQFLNHPAEELTGWREADAVGRPLAEVFPLVDEKSHAPRPLPVAESLADGSIRSLGGPAVLVARGGEVTIEHSVAAIADDAGDVLGAVVVFRDVGVARELERRLALTARMASLATLTAGLGHELNNPLAYNLANLQFVLDHALPRLRHVLGAAAGEERARASLAETEGALADARAGAERMRDTIGTLRGFSREAGAADEEVDLVATVDAAIRLTANEVAQRAPLVRELRARPRVTGHAGQLAQVFTHLLVNAAQAVEPRPGPPRPIRVVVDETDRAAIVDVIDPGTGIAPEVMVRIFEPFFTTRPVGAGAGLGLAIVHGLVTLHGGEVTASSKPGQGSTFRVTLPRLASAGARPPERTAPARAPDPLAEQPAARRRILVVDDDERVSRSLARMLSAHHDVTVVNSPHEAMALVAGGSFDVLLLDLMMPGMTGMDLYAWLRGAAPALAARTLFLTGGVFTADAQAFVVSMGDRVLQKPVRGTVLREAIERAARAR